MARRREIHEDLGDDFRAVLQARWILGVVTGYRHRYPDTPAAVALGDVYAAHESDPPAPLDGWREVRDVLAAHDELEAFEAFRHDHRRFCAGYWPHADAVELRRRVRAI